MILPSPTVIILSDLVVILYLLLDLRLCFTTADGGVDGLDFPLLGTSVVAGGDIGSFAFTTVGIRLGDIFCMSGTRLEEVMTGMKGPDTGEYGGTGLVDMLGTSWFGDGGHGLIGVSVLPSLLTAAYASSSSLLGSVRIDVWVLNLRNVSRNPGKRRFHNF